MKLENLKREAKRRLRAQRAAGSPTTLRAVQLALARERGYAGWTELKLALRSPASATWHDALADDYVAAFAGDAAALARLNQHYQRAFTHDDVKAEVWRRVHAFRERAFKSSAPPVLKRPEAEMILAQDAGFGSWQEWLAASDARRIGLFAVDAQEQCIRPARHLDAADWEALLAAMRERQVRAFDADGQMTDAVLARVTALSQVTSLRLGGSRGLTDDGLLRLTAMPQLEHLDLSEYPGGRITDRGLAVFAHLPNLRSVALAWQSGITDAGLAQLRHCRKLEAVNLMGTPTGDGAVAALASMPNLQRLMTGRLLGDAGLACLADIPRLVARDGGAQLMLDGPFTDAGFRAIHALTGVGDLDLFWHVTQLTAAAMGALAHLPHLEALGCDGRLSDDAAMRHIAALPNLRRLRAQESVATEAGFAALAHSQSLEGFWGRVCPGFATRAFLAFARMPRLRSLGVGCSRVDDRALARLAEFPALRELTPIGFEDAGFRHIGRCAKLERLTCMYCRSTGDAATAHLHGMALKYYYAGLTRITDRSLEMLSAMETIEEFELYEVAGVTDRGVAQLARLPRLRRLSLDSLPGVTPRGAQGFRPDILVRYTT